MNEIRLAGETWRSADDFYNALLPAIGAPEWHGRNLDALNDTLGGNDINKIQQPITFSITGVNQMPPQVRDLVERFRQLVFELRFEGNDLDIRYE